MRQLFGLIALPFLLAAAPPPPSPVLTGQVVDGDGKPVAGAQVQADADGHFRSSRVAAETQVNVSVEHPAYVDAHAPGVEVPAAEPLLVTLQPGRSLSNRVVDPAGKPIAGARLLPSPETGIGSFAVQSLNGGPRTSSDGDGRFVLDGLSPGPLALLVIAEGYRMETVRGLRIPETQPEPVLQIEPLREGERPPSPGWGEGMGEGARG